MFKLCSCKSLYTALMFILLISACSQNPTSSALSGMGNITLRIKGMADQSLSKGGVTTEGITVTSARFVIEKVELENRSDSSVDFKFAQPFVQDLLAITNLADIQTFQVPFGTYDKVKIDIDDLDAQDGDVYTQNPDLQNLSIRIEGYKEDSTQTFVFTSDISINVQLNLNPPIVLDEMSVNSSLVIDFDYTSWFRGGLHRFLDPSDPGNRRFIEQNIQRSFHCFRDNNRDGRQDQEMEIKGRIDSLGTNYIIVSETPIFVTADTKIYSRYRSDLSFSDLAVGMIVEVHADSGDAGRLVARKIEIKNDDSIDTIEYMEIEGTIDSLGANLLVVGDNQIMVADNTKIVRDDKALPFSELQVGMEVEVYATRKDDGSLVALKIKIED